MSVANGFACGCPILRRGWSGGVSVVGDETVASGGSHDSEQPFRALAQISCHDRVSGTHKTQRQAKLIVSILARTARPVCRTGCGDRMCRPTIPQARSDAGPRRPETIGDSARTVDLAGDLQGRVGRPAVWTSGLLVMEEIEASGL